MKVYGTREIRNVGIVGHGHAGKTSLISAILFDAGATSRFGRVDEGTTITDYDEDEIARKLTIHSSLAYCEWNGTKINLLDTPGFAAFILDAKAALRACDAAVVLVDAVNGVEVQTEKVWSYADEFELPRLIVVTKMDRERASFEQAVASINERFGRAAVPLQIPIGSETKFRGVIDLVHMRAYTYGQDGSGQAHRRRCAAGSEGGCRRSTREDNRCSRGEFRSIDGKVLCRRHPERRGLDTRNQSRRLPNAGCFRSWSPRAFAKHRHTTAADFDRRTCCRPPMSLAPRKDIPARRAKRRSSAK